jgi:hypothetical protein
MVFRNSLCIAALISLGVGAVVFFVSPPPPPADAAYGLLSLDAAYPDRYIGDILAGMGVEPFISESTQWVFVDDFGELARIPLDQYEKRLEPFDPRNDGYAERLRSFFVLDGKRRFFIPLSGRTPEFFRTLGDRLQAALGNIPFSIELIRPPELSRIGSPGERVLFALAAAGFLFFSGSPLTAAFLLPLLAALCLTVPGGFAPAAALAALFHSQGGLLREWFALRRYQGKVFFSYKGGFRSGGYSAVPVLAGFWGFYGLIAWAAGMAFPLALAGGAAFCLVLTTAFWVESNRGTGTGHIRFLPVPIRNPGIRRFFPSPGALPFGLAALIVLFLPGLFSAPPPVPEEKGYAQMRGDYQTHAAFQASFSRRPLGGSGGDAGYFQYRLDGDGLIAAESESPYDEDADGGFSGEGIPPFPLEELLVFLETYENPVVFSYTGREIFSALAGFALGLPALFRADRRRWKGKRLYLYSDKRIAA